MKLSAFTRAKDFDASLLPSNDLEILNKKNVPLIAEIEFQIQLIAKGLSYNLDVTDIKKFRIGEQVQLEQDPNNEVDTNAIRLVYDNLRNETICFIQWQHAKILSPLIKNKQVSVISASIQSIDQTDIGQLIINVTLCSTVTVKDSVETELANIRQSTIATINYCNRRQRI